MLTVKIIDTSSLKGFCVTWCVGLTTAQLPGWFSAKKFQLQAQLRCLLLTSSFTISKTLKPERSKKEQPRYPCWGETSSKVYVIFPMKHFTGWSSRQSVNYINMQVYDCVQTYIFNKDYMISYSRLMFITRSRSIGTSIIPKEKLRLL